MQIEFTFSTGEKITTSLVSSPDQADRLSMFRATGTGIEAIDKALKSTVALGIPTRDEEFIGTATGVVAAYKGNKYLLTAGHCTKAGHEYSPLREEWKNPSAC